MSAADLELSRLLDSPAARRAADLSCALAVMIGNAAPHDREVVEKAAGEVFDLALAFLMPSDGDSRESGTS